MYPFTPNGPFGNMMPYSDFHALNLDWVIQIAKNFLDQYTHIQDIITQGETEITEQTAQALEDLGTEYNRLKDLLDTWYETHSEDIATALAAAVESFNTQANAIATEVIGSIPSDYTAFYSEAIKNKYAFTVTDVNDLPVNTMYYVNGGTTNNPTSTGAYVIETIKVLSDADARVQIATKFATGERYFRNYINNAYGSWTGNEIINPITAAYEFTGSDANNLDVNTIYYVPGGTAHNPTSTGAYVIETIKVLADADSRMQIAYNFNNGTRYARRYVASAWTEWYGYDSEYRSNPKYIALGDSIMMGAIWISGQPISYAETKNKIPTRIAHAIGADKNFENRSQSGAAFVRINDEPIIMQQLTSASIVDADLITIAGGRNDSRNSLGTRSSSANDGTICGAIRALIEYIRSQNKKTQIVIIQVTPNTSNNDNVFTETYQGGWSLNSYKEEVGALAKANCIPFIDWEECTAMKTWADQSGAEGNYAHPNNQDTYRQMGNYAAGKVAAVYHG